jgi:hypothetical protein
MTSPFNDVLEVLNKCRYHSGKGFFWDPEIFPEEYSHLSTDIPKWWIRRSNSTGHWFGVDCDMQKKAAENTIIKVPKITISLTTEWATKPKEWYNYKIGTRPLLRGESKQDGILADENISFTIVLPPINSRPYIKIVEPFEKVKLYTSLKGGDLTAEDVFFAARALCGDDTRSYDQFIVAQYDEKHLHLEVEIDNWST